MVFIQSAFIQNADAAFTDIALVFTAAGRFGFARPRKQAEGGTDGKYQGDGDDGQGIHVGWVDGVVAMLFFPA